MSGRREPYARLVKVLGPVAVFVVNSRTVRGERYHVTVRGRGPDALSASCHCVAGGFGALCFHQRRALASYQQRLDPKLKKGRRAVVAS